MSNATTLTMEQRRAIFRAVIEAQDGGQDVTTSRTAVATTYGVTVEQVVAVEREGIEGQWPPL